MADPTERYIDAARGNADGSREATFFLADHYVVYDYDQGRAVDGVHAVAGLGFGRPFSPVGPDQGLDAALKGQGRHARTGFQFRGAKFARVDLATGIGDAGVGPLSEWALTGVSATGVDAAYSDDGKAYFFRGDHYTRYDWGREKPDPGYPRRLAAPLAGIDAAVDGGYLFKGHSYLRVGWDPEPHAAAALRPIREDWPGLVELLLAGKAKAQALVWIADATRHLAVPFDPLFATALATHFHVGPTASAIEKAKVIALVHAQFIRVLAVLGESSTRFRFRTEDEALTRDHCASVPATYVRDSRFNITPLLPDRSPVDRATAILRTAIRVADPTSTVHIAEFEAGYDRSTTAEALRNPSAYAAFARHLSQGRDARFEWAP
ncbi:hemopexin repeat-containing protein [Actinoplanes solisilvae]|uniref:hemopexin repeat-containing protein n=1 Tax=Actinoplanes solisilvae TaxID=2486853 RepID=UPI000FD89A2E|nr:hemopexin repeat-containing protein [Actinoplanes solisilvae]